MELASSRRDASRSQHPGKQVRRWKTGHLGNRGQEPAMGKRSSSVIKKTFGVLCYTRSLLLSF